MTMRTRTLTAVAALTISAAGFALAQDGSTTRTVPMNQPESAQPAPQGGTTFVATPEKGTAADAGATAADQPATPQAAAQQQANGGTDAGTPAGTESAAAPAAADENVVQASEPIAGNEDNQEALSEGGKIEDIAFSFEGPFGSFDQFQLQRGLQVYTEVCSACHGLKLVPIRTLSDPGGPGLPEDQVRAYAANLTEITEPDTGELRTRLPTDNFPTVTGDGMGPDLSLMAKARAGFHGPYGTGIKQLFKGAGGPEYIHALLTGYTGETKEEAGRTFYQNKAFSTGWVRMPPPLSDDVVTYEDGTPATADQMARDVSAFLMWTAEPKMMDRKAVGLVSVLFLIVLTALLYLTNKRLWARHKGKHQPG